MKATKFIAVGALALASATFADLTSDVVGYQSNDMATKQYNPVGVTFITVGAADKFKLGDIAVEGFNYNADMVQVLNAESASAVAKYTYVTPYWDEEDFDGDGKAVGWWVKGHEAEAGYEAGDVVFDAAQGFLCNFPSKAVKFTYAGQVIAGKTELDLTGKQYNLIANFLPRAVKLGEIEVAGFNYNADMLQVLSAENAAAVTKYTYVTPYWDEEDFDGDGATVGWWVKGHEGEAEYRADDTAWAAGDAYLSNFPSKAVKLTFPKAIQ